MRGLSVLGLFLSTYALLYGAFGVQSPFVPELLGERGLPAEDIGLVLAAAMVVRVLVLPSLMALLGRANWWPGRVGRPLGTRTDDHPTEELGAIPQPVRTRG